MSVDHDPDRILSTLIGAERPACFLRGPTVNGVAITWKGYPASADQSSMIALHVQFARNLAEELIGDARNADRSVRRKPIDAGVNIPHIPTRNRTP
ncbi:hypothetical protein [Zavarzinia sp. CC-PAN008]|uniref:hypothetical protein n=1 Tax=Zavarzinia sp. CC-PAN008 TaxID=3243332 RepID=UPI003F747F19